MIPDAVRLEADRDTLHVLPLVTVPLVTPGLQKARLIKNTRLEGVVELFHGAETGSGQIRPDDLPKTFEFGDHNRQDLVLVEALSRLPSYDVFSLRGELRKLKLEVDENEHLRLSDQTKDRISGYMSQFIKPLVLFVYGDKAVKIAGQADLMTLVLSPEQAPSRQDLARLADSLEIRVAELPQFLQDYGDLYMSLAYYQYCLDGVADKLEDFRSWLDTARRDRSVGSNADFAKAGALLESRLVGGTLHIRNTLHTFRARTVDMWAEVSAAKFHAMRSLVLAYQTRIAGALCAITVKLNGWAAAFPSQAAGGMRRRVDFVMNEMRVGLERIQGLAQAGPGA